MSALSVDAFHASVPAGVYALCAEDSDLGQHIKDALETIEKAIAEYGIDGLSISFNGGKDCTVLLHLYRAAVARVAGETSWKEALHAVYVRSPGPFEEVEAFVEECRQSYNLRLDVIEGNIRDGLAWLRESSPQIRAILVGTRRTDPFSGNLRPFSPTDIDKGWPDFMRVNPVLDWSYALVWAFLLRLQVPYCCLYDLGYTSLGSKSNTTPNPLLKSGNGYMPAHALVQQDAERAGRSK
eukprot:Opistho-2@67319